MTDRVRLSLLIGAKVPAEWPPETLADVEGMLAAKLADNPQEAGWWGWYIIARPGVVAQRATLIGSVGCSRWGPQSLPHFGYGVLPAFERRGLTTEAAQALIAWVMAQPGITKVVATTFERHAASIRILERCGFENHGVSPDDSQAAESDRQGRGRLILFVREAQRRSPPNPGT
jgi:RimJ/RimL family protein N-acetyltransferase